MVDESFLTEAEAWAVYREAERTTPAKGVDVQTVIGELSVLGPSTVTSEDLVLLPMEGLVVAVDMRLRIAEAPWSGAERLTRAETTIGPEYGLGWARRLGRAVVRAVQGLVPRKGVS